MQANFKILIKYLIIKIIKIRNMFISLFQMNKKYILVKMKMKMKINKTLKIIKIIQIKIIIINYNHNYKVSKM